MLGIKEIEIVLEFVKLVWIDLCPFVVLVDMLFLPNLICNASYLDKGPLYRKLIIL